MGVGELSECLEGHVFCCGGFNTSWGDCSDENRMIKIKMAEEVQSLLGLGLQIKHHTQNPTEYKRLQAKVQKRGETGGNLGAG